MGTQFRKNHEKDRENSLFLDNYSEFLRRKNFAYVARNKKTPIILSSFDSLYTQRFLLIVRVTRDLITTWSICCDAQ